MAVNRKRKMLAVRTESFDPDDLTLIDVLEEVRRLISVYGETARISTYQLEYSYSDKEYLGVFVQQPETDEQMAYRISQEEQWEETNAARDIAEYARLQTKFGA